MGDVSKWLEEIGFDEYADIFAEHKIDFDILNELSEQDLTILGVTALGDRKRLLQHIAALSERDDVQAGETFGQPSVEDGGLARAHEPERRQLTVMFCDLVGSTELSHQLDPEDLREVMRRYQDTVAGAVNEYEGYVAKFLGDGVLSYFGWPQAYENQPERAVRAGLDAVTAVERLHYKHNVTLQARVGIATGRVVVGDLVGEAVSEAEAVTGETPNLAARLQGVATPGQVVICPLTRELVGEAFDLKDLGFQGLKGFAEPVKAWQVLRKRDIDSRYEANHVAGALPLVGRQEELGLLLRCWEASREGHGQVVLIQGEAGIGKSRLVEALRDQVSADEYVWVAHRCSPYHANSTLFPVIEHMKRVFDWKPEDTAEKKFNKLVAALKHQSVPLEEAVPLYAELMSLQLPANTYEPLELGAKEQRERMLDALSTWLLEEAERTPVLNVWEDLHWADPTTLELLAVYIDQSPTVSMINVLTYRPEFVPPWPTRSHMTPITLNRLERPEIEALIKHQAARKRVPSEVVEHIISKADGVPLYVEELTKSILESDYLHEEADRYTLDGSLSEMAIPATLQDSLMARLDRLPTLREVAQLGAVIGREFAYEMLRHLTPLKEPALQDGLGQLVANELLYQRGRPPRSRYIFKHALIQDAAYQSLLKRTRQQYHQQVAALMEERFPETVEAHPELVAHHYMEAGRTEEAVAYLEEAGQIALRRSANVEAASHLDRALKLLPGLPETHERHKQELKIQMELGPALVAIRGFADRRVGRAYARAFELCHLLDDVTQLPVVLRGRELFHYVRGELTKAREFATQFLDLAEKKQDPSLLVGSYHALGQTLFSLGHLTEARRTVEQGIELFDPERHRLPNWPGGQSGEQCYLYDAFALWILGFPDQAMRRDEEALTMANNLNNPANLANTLVFVAVVHVFCGDLPAARQRAEAAMEISAEHGNPWFLAYGTILRGWARVAMNQSDDGIAEICQGLEAYQTTGSQTWLPFLLALQAETFLRVRRIDDGLSAVGKALKLADETEEGCWRAELFRIKGDLLRTASGNSATGEAERCFLNALEAARRERAKSWELRAATSLARLWCDQGERAKASDLLGPVYSWFSEGFETADLKQAKALLDKLS